MKEFAVALLTILSLAGCEARISAVNSTDTAEIEPPPPPPTPPSQDELYAKAMTLGSGDCSDLKRIELYPFKRGVLGEDPYYDRIFVHIEAYRGCLISAITDRTPVQGISFGPNIVPGTIGDLAYALLVDSGQAEWGICAPNEVTQSAIGAASFYGWPEESTNRTDWEVCVLRELAPNNSFKPTPHRGVARVPTLR